MADSAVLNDAPHIYLTVADEDENQVLELVKSDETGMYIRDNGTWMPINPDDDNPRVWDRILIDVTEDAAELYDSVAAKGEVTADQFNGVLAPEEEMQQ